MTTEWLLCLGAISLAVSIYIIREYGDDENVKLLILPNRKSSKLALPWAVVSLVLFYLYLR